MGEAAIDGYSMETLLFSMQKHILSNDSTSSLSNSTGTASTVVDRSLSLDINSHGNSVGIFRVQESIAGVQELCLSDQGTTSTIPN